MTPPENIVTRLAALGLHGLLAHYGDLESAPWVEQVVLWEEQERQQRSLERRLVAAKLGRFKLLADFDWAWPQKIARDEVEELMTLQFMTEHANCILVGPNGVGKTLIAYNIGHAALLRGHSVLAATASELLNKLAACETAQGLERCLRVLARPDLLIIDELGYLSYDNRYADLLFQLVNRRHGNKSILITTNKPFAQWNEAFDNAGCVVSIVDRLVHRAEIVSIEAKSYRLKEAQERNERRSQERAARRKKQITQAAS
jgi:DNA replication protein DnaC